MVSIRDYIEVASTSPEILAAFYRTQKHVKFMMLVNKYYSEKYDNYLLLISPVSVFERKYTDNFNHLYFILNKSDTRRLFGPNVIASVWCEYSIDQAMLSPAKVLKYIETIEKQDVTISLNTRFIHAIKDYKMRVANCVKNKRDELSKAMIRKEVKQFLNTGELSVNNADCFNLEQYFIFREIIIHVAYIRVTKITPELFPNRVEDSDIDLFIDLIQTPTFRNRYNYS